MECHRYTRGVRSGRKRPAVGFALQACDQGSCPFVLCAKRLASGHSLSVACFTRSSHCVLQLRLLAPMPANPHSFQPSRAGGNQCFYVAFQPDYRHQSIPHLSLVVLATEFESTAFLVLPGRQSCRHMDWFARTGVLSATLMEGHSAARSAGTVALCREFSTVGSYPATRPLLLLLLSLRDDPRRGHRRRDAQLAGSCVRHAHQPPHTHGRSRLLRALLSPDGALRYTLGLRLWMLAIGASRP